jgi:hypothetical protein
MGAAEFWAIPERPTEKVVEMRILDSGALTAWAESKQAESRFPGLIKQLILAVIEPEEICMPSGDATWLPGPDGYVTCLQGNRFVPTGYSVWEMGTDNRIKTKADKDYEKRRSSDLQGLESRGISRSQATFVFATPRVWKNKERWMSERKEEGIWKDVWVVDGEDLVGWLELASALGQQFAAELGRIPSYGLDTPDRAWYNWAGLSNPPASEELAVAGRGKQEEDLIGRLLGEPSALIVRGSSPREAFGFILAALRRIELEDRRQRLISRTLIADDEQVVQRLENLQNQIVVLRHARSQVSGNLVDRRGCHIVVSEGNEVRSLHNVITLQRPSRSEFVKALKGMGMSVEDAERAARESGLSVTVFQRQRHSVNYDVPDWVELPRAAGLLPAVMAGRWDESNEKDREILCLLAGMDDYTRLEGLFSEFLSVDEPPLQKAGDVWALTAPADAFHLTARMLTNQHLSRFKNAFRAVFESIDGRVDVSTDKWLAYGMTAAKGHSKWLRQGLAETLLLIGERGSDAGMVCVGSVTDYAEKVVRGLPGLDDWRILASIRDVYPTLIEAAPRPFLQSLGVLLENRPDDARLLFSDGQNTIGVEGMHTGLLWGLELLAWSPEYLTDVALILARLASVDPGGVLHNRPINSLREIFLWWNPGTNVGSKKCLDTIDLILQREPDIGWSLLEGLLPTFAITTSSETVKPRWRDFGDPADDMKTRSGQIRYMSGIVDRALDCVGSSPERWRAILESQRALAPEQQQKTLQLLDQIAQQANSSEGNDALWDVVRGFVYKHRTHHYTDWALGEPAVSQFERIADRLAPKDIARRYRWLFDEWFPDIPYPSSDGDGVDHQLKEIERLRDKAADAILRAEDVQGLVRLGTTCQYPHFVASAGTKLMDSAEEAFSFLVEAIAVGNCGTTLASNISSGALARFGEQWRDMIMTKAHETAWPSNVMAGLLVRWPDEPATWRDAASLGEEVESEYWRCKPIGTIEGSSDERDYQIGKLIEAKRAAETLERVAYRAKGIPTEALIRLFDAALQELKQGHAEELVRRIALSSHDISKYLGQLRSREDMPRKELAVREYKALPLLGWMYSEGLTIQELMAEDPLFFVSVICDVYLRANRDEDEESVHADCTTELEKARAEAGFRLLRGMHVLPGRNENGEIDESRLLRWIKVARQRASKEDRAVMTDRTIGGVLAHAEEDPQDQVWPHRGVRHVIDELAAPEIERGIRLERVNMRGVYSKAVCEGGGQERELEAQYRGWAAALRSQWPRTARLMDEIAEEWRREALREDDRAEQERLELGM